MPQGDIPAWTWNSAHKFMAMEAIGPKEKTATVKLNQLDVKWILNAHGYTQR